MPPLVPGSAPKNAPRPEPRSIGPKERRQSWRVGIWSRSVKLCSAGVTRVVLALLITSVMANRPMAMAIRLMPSVSSGMSKAKRETPLLMSVPITPRINPTKTMATPLMGEPWPTVDAAIRPSSISAQYSEGPKLRAQPERMGAKNISSTMPTAEPQNEATHFMNKAIPPRPCLAMG